ncbi:glycerate kinase [Pseudoflavonifractor sp. MSJ-37]|uniref:glycerate kinase family protein n=1 Tax=Pseudoflavonifractor sp. MSJ-37 TaxID=2841531 RepID=UPI001C124BA1|nr:glycerate kinase [Pseudoflavonifractor sp. MSJ-37]MBU5434090.1 glycerate kinase [Pseudoflavonifractor sp. MSJ-37]
MEQCIVISDSFKGTLSSIDICRIAKETIPRIFPECRVRTFPVADGGEGTVACFLEAVEESDPVTVTVTGPFGAPVEAVYARWGDHAVIEMAAAAGLPLAGDRGDPERTTTYGVGEMIRHAVEHGCRHILLGIGGSATNDGGCGCAAALGAEFRDAAGRAFVPVGGDLDQIAHIDTAAVEQRLEGVRITVMCDVENPLFGENGAAYVFGPQKGADPAMVRRLDAGLRALDRRIREDLGRSVADQAGAGASGGLGAGAVAFLRAELRSGIDAVLDMLGFDRQLEGTDLVITGEGRIDAQSVQGKVISGVARRTRPKGIPLVAIVGSADDSSDAAYDLGVTAIFPTDRTAVGYPKLCGRCEEDYRRTLLDVLRLYRCAEQS